MSLLTRVKVALALIGLVVFGAGIRLERSELRWTGLAFVLAAWLLRFVKPRKAAEPEVKGE